VFAKKNGFQVDCKLEGKYVPSEGPIAISVNGGGIPLAMIAGRICGTVAGANISSSSPLSDYETQWRHVLEKPLKIAAKNKKLADAFGFRSERSTCFCMNVLGQRRLGNLIRCKSIFP